MKTLKLNPLLSLLFLLGAFGENREAEKTETEAVTEQEFQDPEDAMTSWNKAWNSGDPKQIEGLAASDAVLVLNGREVPVDSIPGFYQDAGSVIKDLELRSLKEGSTDQVAYDTGGVYSYLYHRYHPIPGILYLYMETQR